MKKWLQKLNATVAATALATSSLMTGPAFAASQGSLSSTTSVGSVNISVIKTAQVKITALADISLGHWYITDSDVSINSPACVYSSTAGGGYTILANGDGASNAYTLSDGHSHLLVYAVVWNAGGSTGALADSGDTLAPTVPTAELLADTASASCGTAGNTAQINIHITDGAMVAAPAGTYTGVLTLTVAPN